MRVDSHGSHLVGVDGWIMLVLLAMARGAPRICPGWVQAICHRILGSEEGCWKTMHLVSTNLNHPGIKSQYTRYAHLLNHQVLGPAP